jgi:HD superfamily phosphohydrolase
MDKILLFGIPDEMVMDPVHGAINIFSHETDIIDHPLFQRLRYILQNDVLFLVFPGCGHTRFSHSIGTMHIAARYFRKLTFEYLKKTKIVRITEEQNSSINYIYHCIRLAALLHDTGHSPFSHQFEFCPAVKNLFADKEFLDGCFQEKDFQELIGKLPDKVDHEQFSLRSASSILNKINLPVDPIDILYFMEKSNVNISPKLEKHATGFLGIFLTNWTSSLDESVNAKNIVINFLSVIKGIISGELDADKMDYILRDSYYSGCNYGKYNLDHLLSNLRIGYRWILNDKNRKLKNIQLSLAINDKGIGSLEDFIYARFQLYQELYNHKSVSGFRKILSLAIEEVIRKYPDDLKQALMSSGGFVHFTDAFFWERFRTIAKDDVSSFCNRILLRKKMRYLTKFENKNSEDIEFLLQEKETQIGKKVVFWKSKIKFSSIDEFYKDIKVLARYDDKLELKNISDVTDFFQKFDLEEVYHFFVLEDEVIPLF